MTKNDVKITLTSLNGKNVYFESEISRTLARKIEELLEQNGIVIIAPYNPKTKRHNGDLYV